MTSSNMRSAIYLNSYLSEAQVSEGKKELANMFFASNYLKWNLRWVCEDCIGIEMV